MSNFALSGLSITLGIFLVLFGTMKLTVLFSESMYIDLRKSYIRTYKNFPLSHLTGFNPGGNAVRRFYGTVEIIGGLLLAFAKPLQDLSTGLLLTTFFLHLAALWINGDGLQEASNAILFSLLLICRIMIRIQVFQTNKSEEEKENAAKLRGDIRKRIEQLYTRMENVQAPDDLLEDFINGDVCDDCSVKNKSD